MQFPNLNVTEGFSYNTSANISDNRNFVNFGVTFRNLSEQASCLQRERNKAAKFVKCLVCCSAWFWLGTGLSTAQDTVVFEDDFSEGLAHWHFYNASGGTIPTTTKGNTPPMSGNTLTNRSTSTWTKAITQFSPAALASIGDSITISLDLMLAGNPNGRSGFEIILLNTPTPLEGDHIGTNLGVSPVSNTDGIRLIQYYRTGSEALQFLRVTNNASSKLETMASLSNLGDGDIHHITLTLTRVKEGLQIDYSSGENVYASCIDASPPSYKFNTLLLATNNNSSDSARIDNVVVRRNR